MSFAVEVEGQIHLSTVWVHFGVGWFMTLGVQRHKHIGPSLFCFLFFFWNILSPNLSNYLNKKTVKNAWRTHWFDLFSSCFIFQVSGAFSFTHLDKTRRNTKREKIKTSGWCAIVRPSVARMLADDNSDYLPLPTGIRISFPGKCIVILRESFP